jgi:hypothetical protein
MRFALGFAIPFGVVLAWGLADQWQSRSYLANWMYFAGWSFALPLAAAWGVHVLFGVIRPRRVFDLRAPHHARSVAYGFLTALLAAGTALVAIVLVEPTDLDGPLSDAVIIGASAAAWSAIVHLVLRPIRRARCVACGYDLRGTTGPRCPECGLVGSAEL